MNFWKYQCPTSHNKKPITDFYTLENITSKYRLKTRRIWDIIKEKNIPTVGT